MIGEPLIAENAGIDVRQIGHPCRSLLPRPTSRIVGADGVKPGQPLLPERLFLLRWCLAPGEPAKPDLTL
jgi:hypothetical protein